MASFDGLNVQATEDNAQEKESVNKHEYFNFDSDTTNPNKRQRPGSTGSSSEEPKPWAMDMENLIKTVHETIEVSMKENMKTLVKDVVNDVTANIEKQLEEKLIKKVSNDLLTEVGVKIGELERKFSEFDQTLKEMKESSYHTESSEIEELTSKVNDIQTKVSMYESENEWDRTRNIVIKGLAKQEEETQESLQEDIAELMAEMEITATMANISRAEKSGIITVSFDSVQTRKQVLSNKHKLRKTAKFKNVYIEEDKTFSERRMEANFRKIAQSVPNLTHKGGWIGSTSDK